MERPEEKNRSRKVKGKDDMDGRAGVRMDGWIAQKGKNPFYITTHCRAELLGDVGEQWRHDILLLLPNKVLTASDTKT